MEPCFRVSNLYLQTDIEVRILIFTDVELPLPFYSIASTRMCHSKNQIEGLNRCGVPTIADTLPIYFGASGQIPPDYGQSAHTLTSQIQFQRPRHAIPQFFTVEERLDVLDARSTFATCPNVYVVVPSGKLRVYVDSMSF